MQSLLGQRGLVTVGADTNVGAGQGPPGGMLDVGPLQRSSTQKPLREACTWGGVLGLLNTKFLRRNRSWEDQVFFFSFFFLTHPYLTLMQRCRTEPVFPRCILPSLAEAAPKILGCCSPEQSHCLEEGPRVADCCGPEDQLHSEITVKPLLKSGPRSFSAL